ncbi:MAG: sensor domain-containing diguanylate cyclase [Acidimicrobiia bacterium]|nr:sensor domain-containing diguanylate cyclase [Acidimicrobiia bacterium]
MRSPLNSLLNLVGETLTRAAGAAEAPQEETCPPGDRRAQAFARLGSLPLDLPTLTDVIVSSVRRLVPCDQVELLLVEDDTFATVEGGPRGRVGEVAALTRAVSRGTAARSRPATRTEHSHFGERVRTVTYVPVGSRGNVAAALALCWRSPRLAAASQLEPVEDYCAAVAPALAAARVHQRALVAEADAMTLVDAVSALARTHTVESVAETTCLYARRVAHSRRARFAVVEGDDLVIVAANPDSRHPAHMNDTSTPLMAEAAETGACVEDATPSRQSLNLPMTLDGAVLGVVQFDFSPGAGGIPERTRSLCEAVVAHAGVALARAHRTNELSYLATTDPLTGLANRRRLDSDLVREISRSDRGGEPLAVAMIDIDHFKAYNDEHGHLEGDLLLATFSRYLGAQVRAMDAVGRYGGEEFLLLLPNTTAREAEAVAVRLLRAWRSDSPATFSVGVAQWDAGESPEALIARADAALYEAKAAGRDRVRVAPGASGESARPDDGAARVVALHDPQRRRGA